MGFTYKAAIELNNQHANDIANKGLCYFQATAKVEKTVSVCQINIHAHFDISTNAEL